MLYKLWTVGSVGFSASLKDGRVTTLVESSDVRNVVMLQMVMLLHEVGLQNVRVCGVADCQRLFVKTYRREFCSVRCQQRNYKRIKRQWTKEQKERQAAARRRRKARA